MALLVLALFLVAEVIVRVFWILPGPRWTDHPLLGNVRIPGSESIMKGPDFVSTVKVNSLGFRDTEHDLEKQPGVIRIAFMGDSFVEAAQAELEDRFDKILERRFNDEGITVETLNFGVGGFGTDQEYLTYTILVRDFDPDIVVLVLSPNDFRNNVKELEKSSNKPYFYLNGTSLYYEEPQFDYNVRLRRLVQKSFILTELANTVVSTRKESMMMEASGEGVPPHFEIYLDQLPPKYEPAVAITTRLLESFADTVQKEGRIFHLTDVPPKNQIHEEFEGELHDAYPALREREYDYSNPGEILSAVAKENNFTYLSLTKPLKERCSDLCYVGDGHWNANGVRQLAEILYPVLKEQMTNNGKQ